MGPELPLGPGLPLNPVTDGTLAAFQLVAFVARAIVRTRVAFLTRVAFGTRVAFQAATVGTMVAFPAGLPFWQGLLMKP